MRSWRRLGDARVRARATGSRNKQGELRVLDGEVGGDSETFSTALGRKEEAETSRTGDA
jgi:hypothetical protein